MDRKIFVKEEIKISMNFENVLYEVKDGILYLTLNRPEARNALSPEMWRDITAAVQAARVDDSIRVVIVTHTGDKALASGADIRELHERYYMLQMLGTATEALQALENLNKPTICAINGFALGGGCELSMACDIRLASEKAKFGQPEVGLGITPGFSGTQRLPRRVGIAKAKELIFSGKMIRADEAEKIGLVSAVYAPEALVDGALEMAKSFTKNAPIAVKYAKACIDRGMQMDMDGAIAVENELFAMCFATADQKEGMGAFLEKRKEKHFQNK